MSIAGSERVFGGRARWQQAVCLLAALWAADCEIAPARMNRAWRPKVEGALAGSGARQGAVSFEDRQNQDVLEVVLFSRAP